MKGWECFYEKEVCRGEINNKNKIYCFLRGYFSIGNGGDRICFLVYESLNSSECELFYES